MFINDLVIILFRTKLEGILRRKIANKHNTERVNCMSELARATTISLMDRPSRERQQYKTKKHPIYIIFKQLQKYPTLNLCH